MSFKDGIEVVVDWKDGRHSIEHWDTMCDWVYDTYGEINLRSTANSGTFTFRDEKQAMTFILKWL